MHLFLVVLLVALAVPAQGDDARSEAVADFRRFFKTYKEPSQRVEAIYTLEGMDSREAAEELLGLLDHRDPEVRAAAGQVLAGYSDPETFAWIVGELPKQRNATKQALWIEVLGNAKVEEAVPVLVELVGARRVNAAVKLQAARAFGKIGDRSVGEPLGALLGDGDARVRMAAADAVAALRLQPLVESVIPLLEDKDWKVRSAAAKALGALRSQNAIEPLIALMRGGGRLQEDAAEALFSITALDFGTDADVWTAQWERLEAIDWRIPTDEELAIAVESRRRADAYYGKSETTTFSRVRTTSTRILFIIDVSASMQDTVAEREKFDAGYDDYTKLTIVKTELERTIESLGPNTQFNIVAFASELNVWKKSLVPANVVNKSSATAWVRRLEAIGGGDSAELAGAGLRLSGSVESGKTNTHAALVYPFGVDPKKPTAKPSRKGGELDTVFFLSDGRPSTGRVVDTLEILSEVTRINESFRIVIHAIAIGDFQKEFLRSLAKLNGGTFVDLGR